VPQQMRNPQQEITKDARSINITFFTIPSILSGLPIGPPLCFGWRPRTAGASVPSVSDLLNGLIDLSSDSLDPLRQSVHILGFPLQAVRTHYPIDRLPQDRKFLPRNRKTALDTLGRNRYQVRPLVVRGGDIAALAPLLPTAEKSAGHMLA
jgi:hypothetical protein